MARKNQEPSDRREAIEEKFEAQREQAPVETKIEEEVKPDTVEKTVESEEGAPIEEQPKIEEAIQEKPKRKYADKFESDEDLERGYVEAEKQMHEATKKASQYEQEFSRLKNYIDWDKVKADAQGQPRTQTGETPITMDKDKFFQELGERGPAALTPYMRQQTQDALREILPNVVQAVSVQVKIKDAEETFREQYSHLKEWEPAVVQTMYEDLRKNPGKNVMRAMHDAAKGIQSRLDSYVQEGKKDAQTLHEEKKRDNLPPGDKASKERTGLIKPKVEEEEKPESLSDIIKGRKEIQDKTKSKIGYQYGVKK